MKTIQVPDHLVDDIAKFLRSKEELTIIITRGELEKALSDIDDDTVALKALNAAIRKALNAPSTVDTPWVL